VTEVGVAVYSDPLYDSVTGNLIIHVL